MKQVFNCLERLYDGRSPLKQKWQAVLVDERHLALYHYHHLVLVYDFRIKGVIYEWWELPADKRGLEAAKEFLLDNRDRLPAPFTE